MTVFNQLPTRYSEGTASVAANATTVTGTGTNWTVLQPGDLFGVHKGLAIPIASISTDGLTLTLAYPWPGVAQTNAAYCVQLVPRSVGVQEATRQLLLMLANGRIDDFVNLAAAADKLPYFDGPDSMALADFNAAARALLAGGQLPNSQVRNDLTSDKAFRRGNILGTVAQASGVPTANLIERGSNANGQYVRFADGTQICTRYLVLNGIDQKRLYAGWTFPAAFAGNPNFSLVPNLASFISASFPISNGGSINYTSTIDTNSTSTVVSLETVYASASSGVNVIGIHCTATGWWYQS